MGLTVGSTGRRADSFPELPGGSGERVIALAGNPNVGKSTLFNALTGLKQHTGNWTGKTVGCTAGRCKHAPVPMTLVDLPGTYSLCAHSEEEAVAREFICSGQADAVAVVCDASCLERNLILVLQILALTPDVVVCLNLMDEAKKKGICVDAEALERRLGVPVIPMSARRRRGLEAATEAFCAPAKDVESERKVLRPPEETEELVRLAHEIAIGAVRCDDPDCRRRDRRIDRLLTSRVTGIPVMLLLLALVFWITVQGANYPSAWLSGFLFGLQEPMLAGLAAIGAPEWLSGALVLGVYRTVAWVVSVMLPPMAIFFPLFTLLEDFGYLPRVAFNLDRCFQGCHACGKQALTM